MTEMLALPNDDEGFNKMFESSLASMTKVPLSERLVERVKAAQLTADRLMPDSESLRLYLQCETVEKRAAIMQLLTAAGDKDVDA